MVPNGWSNTTIDDNISFSGGAQPPRSVFAFEPQEGFIRLIQIRDYKTDKFATYIPKDLARKLCTADDVMIGRYGPPIFQILRGLEGAYNVALIKAIPKEGVDKEFMYYSLKRNDLFRLIDSHSQRTSGQTGIEMDALKAFPMPLPPLPEQQKIAKILTTWDKAIDSTERLIDNSKKQKKALMQQLLTGKKRLLDNKGKRFEGEWELKKVSDYFDVSSSKRVLQEDWKDEGVPFYRTRELVSLAKNEPFRSSIYIAEDYYEELITKYGMPDEGDFLVSGVGTLGIIYQVRENDKFYFKDGNVLWFKKEKEVSSDFFKYCFLSDYIQNQINIQASVTTVGTYTITNAKKTRFHCPPLAEQQKIATVLTNADKEIELLEQQLADLQQEKKALMQVLLTGKVRVLVDG